MLRPHSLPLLTLSLLTLAGCGGGGGGGSSNPPPAPPPATNTPPAFGTTAFNATEDADLAATLTATDAQGQAITFAKVTDPAHGAATVSASGSLAYRGAADFFGTDTFTVSATDSAGAQSTATVTITVAGVNDTPTIRNDVLTATGTSPLIDVLANDTEPDGEALTLTLVDAPDFGTATVENGRVRLSLPAGFQGFNTFSYRAEDGAGGGVTARAAVFIDAQPVRFFYLTNEEGDYAQNIYADDLVSRRQVTSFTTTSPTGLGQWMFVSDNGRTILYDEVDRVGSLGRRFWTAAPADGSSEPRRINPALTAGQSIELASDPSPDGRWVVYRVSHASAATRFYLADLTTNTAPREIVPPAGALEIDVTGRDILFDPLSQHFILPVQMQLAGGTWGTTLYRAPVTDPSALTLFFKAAEPERSTYAVYVSPDGNRAIAISGGTTGTRLFLARTSDPTNPLAVSPLLTDPNQMMGSYLADWAHDRLMFNFDSVPWVPPYTSTTYLANLATASWTMLGHLPADFTRPEFFDVHPSGDSVLITTRFTDPMTGITEELREIGLVAGLPSRTFARVNAFVGPRYTNGGDTVMQVPIGGSVLTSPRNDPSQSKSQFTAGIASNYRSSPDGKILSASGRESPTPQSDDCVWAFNQTNAGGTFARRLVKVPSAGKQFTYVSVGTIAPRY